MPDQLQETSARGVVLVVPAEVIGQAAYTLGEKRYLHFRGAGVPRLRLVLSDDALLGRCVQHVPSRGTLSSVRSFFCSHTSIHHPVLMGRGGRSQDRAPPARNARGYHRWVRCHSIGGQPAGVHWYRPLPAIRSPGTSCPLSAYPSICSKPSSGPHWLGFSACSPGCCRSRARAVRRPPHRRLPPKRRPPSRRPPGRPVAPLQGQPQRLFLTRHRKLQLRQQRPLPLQPPQTQRKPRRLSRRLASRLSAAAPITRARSRKAASRYVGVASTLQIPRMSLDRSISARHLPRMENASRSSAAERFTPVRSERTVQLSAGAPRQGTAPGDVATLGMARRFRPKTRSSSPSAAGPGTPADCATTGRPSAGGPTTTVNRPLLRMSGSFP